MVTTTVNFFSQTLKRMVSFQACLPNDNIAWMGMPSEKRAPWKTLYLLHGMTNDQNSWLFRSTLVSAITDYPICVIMPAGENTFYANSELSALPMSDFLCGELIDFTRGLFPLSDRREDTFIGGYSMGGFGAIVNGLRHPEIFSHITSFSAALIKRMILQAEDEPGLDYFTRRQYETMFSLDHISAFDGCEFDYESLAKHLVVSGSLLPKIYMDCGTEDVTLHKVNEQFKNDLKLLGYDVTWSSRPGGHCMDFWNDSIRNAMDFLPMEKMIVAEDNPYALREKRMREGMERKMCGCV